MTAGMGKVIQHLRGATSLPEEAEPTEGQLLECFVSHRESAALEALVRRHGPMVWGVCRRILRHQQDAEDAFQATFLVLVRRAASVRPREMVGNWLYGVARQTALKARASAAKRRTRERQMADMPDPAAKEQDFSREMQAVLDQELSRLPNKYRVVLVLCDLEGWTRKEAARQLGLPEGTLAGRLTRGRALLGKRLARHGLTVGGGTLAALLSPEKALAGVPASVLSATIRAMTLVATGQASASGLVSARVATLADEVGKTMGLAKLRITVAAVVFLGFVAAGASPLTSRTATGQNDTPPAGEPVAVAPRQKNVTDPKGDSAPNPKLRFTLEGHRNFVTSVAYSPDGKTLASAGVNRTIKLWDVATGREKATFARHSDAHPVPYSTDLKAVVFSPDGKLLASGSADKTIQLCDVDTGKVLAILRGHTDGVTSLAFSPDGKTLASASLDETIRLWDVATRKQRATLKGHSEWVWSVVFSPDGKALASASGDRTVRLWNVAAGTEQATLKGHRYTVHAVAFSPDGKTLASAGMDKAIQLWDVASRKNTATLRGHASDIHALVFSRDGKTLASASGDDTVKLWDVATGKVKATLTGHTDRVTCVGFSPRGRGLATGSHDGTIKLWDLAAPRQPDG
jgi:RNA polymerase sigma factor (sigma-70 family)